MEAITELMSTDIAQVLLPLIVTGALGPAAITLVIQVLRLKYVRSTVGGVCFAGGKWFSFMLTRVLDRFKKGAGEAVETALEDFVEEVVWKRFKEGMNKDDK
jgi:hypothetical protein